MRTRIKNLQAKENEVIKELDAALHFYYDKILPVEESFKKSLSERIVLVHALYKTPKSFTKKELAELKDIILDDLNMAFGMYESHEFPAELKEIFEVLTKISYEKKAESALSDVKQEIEDFCAASGIDIDLSHISPDIPQEEMLRRMFQEMDKAIKSKQRMYQEDFKTKKEREREQKEKALQDIKKNSLGGIYKKLVKILHPDFEQDAQQRAIKEELMMKLTDAHQRDDLYEILKLETEWAGKSKEVQSSEELEVYNSILKDQVKELQVKLDMLLMHPRYMSIRRFYGNCFEGVAHLKNIVVQLKKEAQSLNNNIAQLKTPEAKCLVKDAIKERLEMKKFAFF